MFPKDNKRIRFCVFPGYNWCGPGCSGPGYPVNKVDALCKAHDECYRLNGDRCYCDSELLRRLRPYLAEDTQMGNHARNLHNYMRLQMRFTCRRRRAW
ncbi:phospholipase [Sporosarcina luteola]|uniref:phospholipase n=1 Tax=Sporosarcina luteola TaxID=582850 RepID=UPI0011BF3A9D|nr:phospholipase [Sporosarcina luteola]